MGAPLPLTTTGLRTLEPTFLPTKSTTMSSSSAIALSGMSAARVSLQASAHNIANLNTEGFRRQQVAQSAVPAVGVSASQSQAAQPGNAPATDMVRLLQAKNSFLVNLAVFRTGDRMMGALLDVAG